MSEPDRNRFSARLRRLPGELLLALVNATAILVMAAAILVLSRFGASKISPATSSRQ